MENHLPQFFPSPFAHPMTSQFPLSTMQTYLPLNVPQYAQQTKTPPNYINYAFNSNSTYQSTGVDISNYITNGEKRVIVSNNQNDFPRDVNIQQEVACRSYGGNTENDENVYRTDVVISDVKYPTSDITSPTDDFNSTNSDGNSEKMSVDIESEECDVDHNDNSKISIPANIADEIKEFLLFPHNVVESNENSELSITNLEVPTTTTFTAKQNSNYSTTHFSWPYSTVTAFDKLAAATSQHSPNICKNAQTYEPCKHIPSLLSYSSNTPVHKTDKGIWNPMTPLRSSTDEHNAASIDEVTAIQTLVDTGAEKHHLPETDDISDDDSVDDTPSDHVSISPSDQVTKSYTNRRKQTFTENNYGVFNINYTGERVNCNLFEPPISAETTIANSAENEVTVVDSKYRASSPKIHTDITSTHTITDNFEYHTESTSKNDRPIDITPVEKVPEVINCSVVDCPATFDDVKSRDYHQLTHVAVYVCPESHCRQHYLCVLKLNSHYAIHTTQSTDRSTCDANAINLDPQTTVSDVTETRPNTYITVGEIDDDDLDDKPLVIDTEYDSGNSNCSSPIHASDTSRSELSIMSVSDEAIDLSVGSDRRRSESTNSSIEEHSEVNDCFVGNSSTSVDDTMIRNYGNLTQTHKRLREQLEMKDPVLVPNQNSISSNFPNQIPTESPDDDSNPTSKKRRVTKPENPLPWMKTSDNRNRTILMFEYTNGYQEEHEIAPGRLSDTPRENERCFACTKCPFRSSVKPNALRHVASARDHVMALICVACSVPFSSESTLHHHIEEKHRPSQNSQIYGCPQEFCNRKFTNSHAAANHVLTTGHGDRRYTCPEEGCGKKFRTRGQLNHHHPIHTNLFRCQEPGCEKRFRDAYNLRMHSMIHTGERPKVCPHCPFSCIQKNSLDWHIKKHHPGQTLT